MGEVEELLKAVLTQEPKPWQQYLAMLPKALSAANLDWEFLVASGVWLQLGIPAEAARPRFWQEMILRILSELRPFGREAFSDGMVAVASWQEEQTVEGVKRLSISEW